MSEKGVKIIYGEISPGAKENFFPSSNSNQFDTLQQLMGNNLKFNGYANPCELYQTVLDGGAPAFPSKPENENIGFWSKSVSGEDGVFSSVPSIAFSSDNSYSTSGITLTFDTDRNIYPTEIYVAWYRKGGSLPTEVSSKFFYPNSSVYFCENRVENFDSIAISFRSLNMPQNRLKLRSIEFGRGLTFFAKNLKSARVIQELNPISSEISINTVDFEVISNQDAGYFFQRNQPVSVYFNGKLIATQFVKSSKRTSRNHWSVQTDDYIGIMDSVPFYGGVYSGDITAYSLLEQIFKTAGVPFSINEKLDFVYVYGYIPLTTCREAAMQVAFSVQNVIDTSNSEKVNVFELSDDVTQTISLRRIIQGQNFNEEETVTSVEVVYHSYAKSEEEKTIYKTAEEEAGQDVFVRFSEPMHDLEISNGKIIESGNNYAIINANVGGVLSGKKFDHTEQAKRKNNPNVISGDLENVITIQNATLVSKNNVDNVLGKCYNWLVKKRSIDMKFAEGKHRENGETVYDKVVNVGDVVVSETEYLGNLQGRVTRQSFNLNGGIIVKEAVIR